MPTNTLTGKIQVTKTMLGPVYTFTWQGHDLDGNPFTHETSLKFSPRPLLVFGRSLTPIDSPERFGKWGTHAQRLAYCRNFIELDPSPTL